MPRSAATHQQTLAQKQREHVRERVQQAISAIRAEVEANFRKGKKVYPRRLSQAEVLRRGRHRQKYT
jgi:hypothetical protein